MKIHHIFPIEIFTFKNVDLVDPVLDALDPIDRGMFNLPHPVQSTKGNLHNLPEFKPLTDWIHECLDEIQKDQEFEMWGKFEISMMWGNVSMPHSHGMHQPHRHPLSYWSGIYCLSEGHPTQFQDEFRANIAFNALPTGPINFGPFGQNMVNIKLIQDDPVIQPDPE
jgi:hypothetical protein